MLLQRLSLDEIARKRNLSQGTIIKHIEQLVKIDEIIDLSYLKPSEEDYIKIKTALLQCGDEKLRPVYEALREKYPFEKIRLVRLLDKQKISF